MAQILVARSNSSGHQTPESPFRQIETATHYLPYEPSPPLHKFPVDPDLYEHLSILDTLTFTSDFISEFDTNCVEEVNLFNTFTRHIFKKLSKIIEKPVEKPVEKVIRTTIGQVCYTSEQFARVAFGEIQPGCILQLLDFPKRIISERLSLDNLNGRAKLAACRDALTDYEEELVVSLGRLSRYLGAKPDSSYQGLKEKDEIFAKLGPDACEGKEEIFVESDQLVAEKNRRAMTEAIEEIQWEIGNPHEMCRTSFEDSRIEMDEIAYKFTKGKFECDVKIFLEKTWKSATLVLLEATVHLIVAGRELIPRRYLGSAKTKRHKFPRQFTLIIANEFEWTVEKYTCEVESESLRDEIVLMSKAFHAKDFEDCRLKRTHNWSKPEKEGWFKLNVDVYKEVETGEMGIGGVIRDGSSYWIIGFMKRVEIGRYKIDHEILALKEGLELAKKENLAIEIETDSDLLEVVISTASYDDPLICQEIYHVRDECRDLLKIVKYKFKTDTNMGSRVARRLAKAGSNMTKKKVKVMRRAPEELYGVLLDESRALRYWHTQRNCRQSSV